MRKHSLRLAGGALLWLAFPVAALAPAAATTETELRAACDQGQGDACARLLEAWEEAQRPDHRKALQADCIARTGDAVACIANDDIGALAAALDEHTPTPRLDEAQLDYLYARCLATGAACERVARHLGLAGRMLDAREALARVCAAGDPPICDDYRRLAGMDADALTPLPASALPCGTYADGDHRLRFMDGGRVETGLLPRKQARLQDGRIALDDMGDTPEFFAAARGGLLLGLGPLFPFVVLRVEASEAHCAAPTPLRAIEPAVRCHLGEQTLAQCCDRDDALACHALGRARELDDPATAFARLERACGLGLANSCKRLLDSDAWPFSRAARAIVATCAHDPGHVACDLAERYDIAE